jgi:hypothetical protein
MVQRTSALPPAAGGGHESAGVMKGEVVSSILTGSTIFSLTGRRPSARAALGPGRVAP